MVCIAKLVESEEFQASAQNINSPEELTQLLNNHGIEITEDETHELLNELVKYNSGSLEEEFLEDVTGGGVTAVVLMAREFVVGFKKGWNSEAKFRKWCKQRKWCASTYY